MDRIGYNKMSYRMFRLFDNPPNFEIGIHFNWRHNAYAQIDTVNFPLPDSIASRYKKPCPESYTTWHCSKKSIRTFVDLRIHI